MSTDRASGDLVVFAWALDASRGAITPSEFAPSTRGPQPRGWWCASCDFQLDPGENCVVCSSLKIERCMATTKKGMPCTRWVCGGGPCHQHGGSKNE